MIDLISFYRIIIML